MMRRRIGRSWLLPCAAMLAALPLHAAKGPEDGFEHTVTAPMARGAWRSQGYGYVLEVTADGPQLYHQLGKVCFRDPRGADPDAQFSEFRPIGERLAQFQSDSKATPYWFEWLPRLPDACRRTSALQPLEIFDFVVGNFSRYYPALAQRAPKWTAQAAAARARIAARPGEAQVADELAALLRGIDDPHVEFEAYVGELAYVAQPGDSPTVRRVRQRSDAGEETGAVERAWRRAYRQGITDTILQGNGHAGANDRIFWGTVGDIGYLNVVTMGRFGGDDEEADLVIFDRVLDRVMNDFTGCRAVVVDVSNNRGGYDTVSRALAARFARRPFVAYSKQAVGATLPPFSFHIDPASGPRYTGPVYVVSSDITVGAGETFVMAMRALPNVQHVGQATRGALSDQIQKPLPNGWTLSLSAEIYRDVSGRWPEVSGIAPRTPLVVFPADDLDGGHARALSGFIASLGERAPRARRLTLKH